MVVAAVDADVGAVADVAAAEVVVVAADRVVRAVVAVEAPVVKVVAVVAAARAVVATAVVEAVVAISSRAKDRTSWKTWSRSTVSPRS